MNSNRGENASVAPMVPGIFPADEALSGFTTRRGGVSEPPFDSLNLGYGTPDDRSAVEENHGIVFRYLGVEPENAVFMEQVHGGRVAVVETGGTVPGADGIVTVTRGLLLGVKCADCIPLLLYDPAGKAAGAVHCGWRSIVSGAAGNAVRLMKDIAGSDPGNILAAVGPSAGPCCYEIGSDVASRFHGDSVEARGGKLYGDLRSELKRRLVGHGLREENIELFPDCTVCDESLYYSHRRDGTMSGRMLGYIMLVNGASGDGCR